MVGIKLNNKTQSLHNQLIDEIRQYALGQAPGTRLPSENDLSQSLGIARMTVSRAMNQLAGEGIIYRERGRGTFAAGQSEPTIYLILPGGSPEFSRDIGVALRERSQEQNIRLEVINQVIAGQRYTDIDMTALKKLPFRSRVILTGNWFHHVVDFFQQRQCRVLLINFRNERYFIDSASLGWSLIETDLTGIIIKIIRNLQEHGCRRIAMLQSGNHYMSSTSHSFREALKQCGLEFFPELLFTSPRSVNDAFNHMDMALQLRRRFPFDAFIASTAPLLNGALQAMQYHQIRIPDEIWPAALCGRGELGTYPFPLITASLPFRECGLKAIDTLCREDYRQEHYIFKETGQS